MLTLDSDQIEAALYAVADMVTQRRLAGRNTPKEVKALHRALTDASQHNTSAHGTVIGATPHDAEQSNNARIDSTTAAHILGCTPRHIRAIANHLGGERVGGRWTFPHTAVLNYADTKPRQRRITHQT